MQTWETLKSDKWNRHCGAPQWGTVPLWAGETLSRPGETAELQWSLGKQPSAGVAVVLLRPELSARAQKQGGEPWSRLVPTFGVTYLCCVGCRQPSWGRVLGQAAPAGSARGRLLLQEWTQLCLASL